ncbi:hypothetical protein FACS18948_3870 [Clostridia bacterium]|nr:hypothetical protein FACS18948_3870 [Clostridia bacterium]
MTAKEYLEKVWDLESRVESKLYQVQSLRELATNACGRLSGMPRNPSPDLQPISNIVAKITDLEKEADDAVDELVDYKREVSDTLSQIGYPYGRLLEFRYFDRKKWHEICKELKYSSASIQRFHTKALQLIDERLINYDTR